MHDFPILCVEDEEYDILFLKRAFAVAGITNPLPVVMDGQEAIDYLSGVGPYANRLLHPFPGLILLDLKLPRRSGLDVLKWIRQQSNMKQPLVVIYTSSSQPKDVEAAYQLGANGYLIKQGNPAQLNQMAKVFLDYWLVHNHPPCRCTAQEAKP